MLVNNIIYNFLPIFNDITKNMEKLGKNCRYSRKIESLNFCMKKKILPNGAKLPKLWKINIKFRTGQASNAAKDTTITLIRALEKRNGHRKKKNYLSACINSMAINGRI